MEDKKHVKVSVIKLSIIVVCAVVVLVTAGLVYNFYKKPKLSSETKDSNSVIEKEKNTESINSDEKVINENKNEENNNIEIQNKKNNANESKTNEKINTNTYNNNINNQESISDNTVNNTSGNQINLNDYLGSWYETHNHTNDKNPSNVKIKNVNNNKLVIDLYISRTAQFNNFEVNMNGNTGSFEAVTDNGPSIDGQIAKISGKIELSNNTVTINVTKSNVKYLNDGTKYIFTYKVKNTNLNSYKGNWYESSKHASDLNPNNINLKTVDGEFVVFDFYITRIANFDDVSVIVSENYGKFEAITENGRSTDDEIGKISGRIEFKNNNIILHVEKSNVFDLGAGKEYTFTHKSN